jgi:hypothetical protein
MPLLVMLWLATMTVVPKGVILIKGATPSVSDASLPVPEDGKVSARSYRNAYFGLEYPIPAGWTEQPAGPPPSDSGAYVLGEFALLDGARVRAHVLVTAQDLFFARQKVASAKGAVLLARRAAEAHYAIDGGEGEVAIGGRVFHRLAYSAPRSRLHWRILATDTRCHALIFTFTGTDAGALDDAERAMRAVALGNEVPRCVDDYARDHLVEKTSPSFPQRYNTIPARLLIDANGNVKHVHVLSAFPEQSQAIIEAVQKWRFEPYVAGGKAVEVETGVVFGGPPPDMSAR